MNYENTVTYSDDILLIRFFWKNVGRNQGQFLQLIIDRIAYTQLINDMDRGISGAFYKVISVSKQVHRINKYEIRDFTAREIDSARIIGIT